jgi:hypothetical protein
MCVATLDIEDRNLERQAEQGQEVRLVVEQAVQVVANRHEAARGRLGQEIDGRCHCQW